MSLVSLPPWADDISHDHSRVAGSWPRAAECLARREAAYIFPTATMPENPNTIGLQDLLDEISRDLDNFRKKHASDYGVKNITLWWDMEKERLLVRHVPSSVVRTITGARSVRRAIGWFTAGLVALGAVQTAIRLLAG